MAEEVTIESAVQSIRRWNPDQIESFNSSDTPWNVTGQVQQQGEAPNTVDQVLEYIGNKLSEPSFQIASLLLDEDIKLGFVAGHNPCF